MNAGAKLIARVLVVALVLAGIIGAAGQDAPELGDVRYSVLDPTHFQAVHGTGWILMDGRNIDGTALCSDQGLCKLPDARGVFIRGMNVGQSSGVGDPEGDRALGDYQADALKAHEHNYQEWRWQVTTGAGPYADGLTANAGNKPNVSTTGGPTSAETRPRNIALYTYIKVDE